MPGLRGILLQAQANLRDWKVLDSAAASHDAPTLEELDRSSRTHSRRGSRCFSRMDSASGSPMPERRHRLGGGSETSRSARCLSRPRPPIFLPPSKAKG